MPLHLIKLCVGVATVADLDDRVAERSRLQRAAGQPVEIAHATRMLPTRAAEIRDGGSLYWVVHGHVAARQLIRDIRPFTDAEGIKRCHLVLDATVVAVLSRPCRPFQGWRYLTHADRPLDLADIGGDAVEMPEHLRHDLRELGLL